MLIRCVDVVFNGIIEVFELFTQLSNYYDLLCVQIPPFRWVFFCADFVQILCRIVQKYTYLCKNMIKIQLRIAACIRR